MKTIIVRYLVYSGSTRANTCSGETATQAGQDVLFNKLNYKVCRLNIVLNITNKLLKFMVPYRLVDLRVYRGVVRAGPVLYSHHTVVFVYGAAKVCKFAHADHV